MDKSKRLEREMKLAFAIARIFTHVPNEDAAAIRIFDYRKKISQIVCRCDEPSFLISNCARSASCQGCSTKVLTTKGTVMEDSNHLLPWLVAIELLEQRLTISPTQLARMMNISLGSAQLIMKKISIVIEENMPNEVLRISAEKFKDVICKRSSNTPALEHPYAEQLAIETANRRDESSDMVSLSDKLTPTEAKVFSTLSQTPISAETIHTLTLLPIAQINSAITSLDIFHQLIAEDIHGRFKRAEPKAGSILVQELQGLSAEEVDELIAVALIYLKENFQAVSRRFLQIPLSLFWCVSDGKRWSKDSLLLACLRHPPITPAQLAAYTSPPLIKIMPFPSEPSRRNLAPSAVPSATPDHELDRVQ